jgi:outer membrane usher protein
MTSRYSHTAAILISLWTGIASGQTALPTTPVSERILPLEAVVNGVKSGTWLFVERDGKFYASRSAFDEWRLPVRSDAQALIVKGESYWPLHVVPGFTVARDLANQSLNINFAPENFPGTLLTNQRVKRPSVSPVLPSVFLNYDLNYSAASQSNASTTKDIGLLSELGVSIGLGVFTSSVVGRNLSNSPNAGTPRQWRRLETTFTKDFPGQNHTLRLGDSTTRAGVLGRNIYFGGIQYGSNYALTPGFWAQPLPVLSGLSAAPSTVDLYVNDVLRQTSNVPTGPFVVDNFPALTGNGQVRMVVRDILGRETVVTQPFFTHDRLLATGLNDWSVEAGRQRRELGQASNHYGSSFASGLWRRGLTDGATLESRGEATAEIRGAGLGLAIALPYQVLGRAAGAISHEQSSGQGHQWLWGLDRQSDRVNMQLEMQGASAKFRQMGLEAQTLPIQRQLAASGSYRFSQNASSVGMSYVEIHRHDAARIATLSANYSMPAGERGTLNFIASRTRADTQAKSLSVNLVVPFEHNRMVTAAVQSNNGRTDAYASASQSLNQEEGVGWRVLAGQQAEQSRAEGGVSYLGRYGQVNGEVSASGGQTALRMGARGAFVAVDGNVFVTRYLDQSFAVAEVAGYGDIGIGLGGKSLSHTNASGVALVPQLSAYQLNSIRLDGTELPMSAEIDSIERSVVPSWRSAVKVKFPVRSGRGALLKIVFDDNEPAPAGAIVGIEGDTQEFYVARRGEAFVTGLLTVNKLMLKWKNQQCPLELTLPVAIKDDIPRSGPLVCKGVAR